MKTLPAYFKHSFLSLIILMLAVFLIETGLGLAMLRMIGYTVLSSLLVAVFLLTKVWIQSSMENVEMHHKGSYRAGYKR